MMLYFNIPFISDIILFLASGLPHLLKSLLLDTHATIKVLAVHMWGILCYIPHAV